MDGNSARNATADTAPSETEKTLLRIWVEVLNTENIGIHDDFLGLGGDSMTAMRCINRINTAFGVELPIDLFLLESVDIFQAASAIARMQLAATPENA